VKLRPRTLRGRVSLLGFAVIAGWLVVLATGFDLVLVSRLDQQVDDVLQVRAQAASATLSFSGGQVSGVRESATDSELDSSVWVYTADHAIKRPGLRPRLQRVADGLAASDHPTFVEHGGDRFYVLPVRTGHQRAGSVVVAVDLDPYQRTRDTAIFGTIVIGVLLLAGAYPVLRIATARALRPVGGMTRQAAEWSVHSPAKRFGPEQHYAELSSLAETLDELLDRLAAVLRHERHFSAELSHELRTPLARVTTQVELMLDTARPDQHAELLAIRDNCAAMDGIIETLLAAARSELTPTVGRCALGPVLAQFSSSDRSAASVVAESTTLVAGVEADIVTRILTPIVDNARRYARSMIRLTAKRAGTAIAVDVTNDGPRISADLTDKIFEPGFRDSSDGHDGVGLGLALARRLARSIDGDVTVVESASETAFRLVLPAG
jgi:signal transduction histidine kinase